MKRILALVLSMLMVLCLFSGCGKDEANPSAPDVNGDGRVDTTDVQLLMAAVWAQQKQEQETP